MFHGPAGIIRRDAFQAPSIDLTRRFLSAGDLVAVGVLKNKDVVVAWVHPRSALGSVFTGSEQAWRLVVYLYVNLRIPGTIPANVIIWTDADVRGPACETGFLAPIEFPRIVKAVCVARLVRLPVTRVPEVPVFRIPPVVVNGVQTAVGQTLLVRGVTMPVAWALIDRASVVPLRGSSPAETHRVCDCSRQHEDQYS